MLFININAENGRHWHFLRRIIRLFYDFEGRIVMFQDIILFALFAVSFLAQFCHSEKKLLIIYIFLFS